LPFSTDLVNNEVLADGDRENSDEDLFGLDEPADAEFDEDVDDGADDELDNDTGDEADG